MASKRASRARSKSRKADLDVEDSNMQGMEEIAGRRRVNLTKYDDIQALIAEEGKNKNGGLFPSWISLLMLLIICCLGVFSYQQYQTVKLMEQQRTEYQNGTANPWEEDIAQLQNEIHTMGEDKKDLLEKLQQSRKQYDDLESLYYDLQQNNPNCKHNDAGSDDRAKASYSQDDIEDLMYCWVDQVFGTSFFGSQRDCGRLKQEKEDKR